MVRLVGGDGMMTLNTTRFVPEDWGKKLAAMLRYRRWAVSLRHTPECVVGELLITTDATEALCDLLLAKIELEGSGWKGGFKGGR